jgi:outer membrane autotransporter protein
MDRSRSIVSALLATTSVVAMIAAGSGPARAACTTITGASGGFSNPNGTTIPCITLDNATVTGNVINAGALTPGGPTGILVINNSTINGSIVNSGTIAANGANGKGIRVNSPILTGGISNSGSIVANSFGMNVLNAVSFSGGMVNSGTINSGNIAMYAAVSASFAGGMLNTGTITSAAGGMGAISVTNFAGGIANAGTILTADTTGGIFLIGVSTFSGGITNTGTISAGPNAPGISIAGGSVFAGGITNSGIISAGATGVTVTGVSSFTGGITNSGTITAGSSATAGIFVSVSTFVGGVINSGTILVANEDGIDIHAGSIFSGGITNSGTIAVGEYGIDVRNISAFSGGISNSGTITTDFSRAISVAGVSIFSGGIANSGTIAAGPFGAGIGINTVSTFTGGIGNSGTITSTIEGIFVSAVSTFAGGITNSGTISSTARTAIAVKNNSVVTGGISNSGMISAGITGIALVLTSTFSGGITNSGTISAAGSGVQVLQISTFAGGISNSGTVVSQNVEAISVATVSNFSGGITNTGSIAAPTSRAVNIFHVSTFTGGVINSGTISGLTGILVRGGATFSGAIVNSGNISGSNGAIDVSAAPNAMTVNQSGGTVTGAIKLSPFADVLNVSGGAINGNIVGQGVSNTVNFALGNATFIYDSPFSITGVNQINVNSGLVILNGSNSATNVAVNAGTLEVGDASHLSAMLTATNGINVAAGGTLSGHGTVVGNIGIPSGATLAPGGSIGTLNVTGNLSLAAGSFYQVEVNAAGAGSKTIATGTAAIAGGTVEVIEQPGTYPLTSKYTILTANGGVNGTFTNAVSDFAFLTPVLSYDANDVFLTLSRNATFFQNLAQTSNQRSVGAALDASPLGSAIVAPVLFQTAAGARQAYDALSGEVHGSVQSEILDDSLYVRQAILGRLRQAGFSHAPDVMAALGFAGPVTVAGSGESPALGYASASGFPAKAPPAAAPTFGSDVAFWSQGVGASGHIDGDGNAASARRDLAGFFTGFDARFGEFARIGLAGGYTHSSLSVDARASSAGIDTAHLGAYAVGSVGAFNLRAGATYGFHTIDTSRTIAFPGFLDSARAHYDGGTGQVFGEVGYGVALGRIAAEPFAGLAWVHLSTGGFAETGGIAALNGSGSKDDVGYSTLGARMATSFLLPNGMALIPRASAAWQHAFNDIAPTAALAFQNTGAGFSITGVPLARDAALVETGLDLRVSPQAKLGLSYSGQLAGHLQDHAVKGNFTWNF